MPLDNHCQIEEILIEEDIENLFHFGCPYDEYAQEARSIYALLEDGISLMEIYLIVESVFWESFNAPNYSPYYPRWRFRRNKSINSVVEKIYKLMRKI